MPIILVVPLLYHVPSAVIELKSFSYDADTYLSAGWRLVWDEMEVIIDRLR